MEERRKNFDPLGQLPKIVKDRQQEKVRQRDVFADEKIMLGKRRVDDTKGMGSVRFGGGASSLVHQSILEWSRNPFNDDSRMIGGST